VLVTLPEQEIAEAVYTGCSEQKVDGRSASGIGMSGKCSFAYVLWIRVVPRRDPRFE